MVEKCLDIKLDLKTSEFEVTDLDKDEKLYYGEFKLMIAKLIDDMSEEEVVQLFNHFDKGKNGTVSVREFDLAVMPPIIEERKKIIEDAFKIIKKSEDGEITVDDLEYIYKKEADYVSGAKSKEEIVTEFLSQYKPFYAKETDSYKNGKLTKQEFVDFYAMKSWDLFLSDDAFSQSINRDWDLSSMESADFPCV